MAAYSGAWFLGWNFQRPDLQLVRPYQRNTVPFQKLIDFWTSKRTNSWVNVTKPELLPAVLFKAMCHGFCVFQCDRSQMVCMSFCVWRYCLILSFHMIVSYLDFPSQIVGDTCYFEINVIVFHEPIDNCSSENFSPQSGTDFPLLLTFLFASHHSGYLGKFLGIRHVWSLKHATSILLPCFILTRHPKLSFNSSNSNLDVWLKNI